MPLRVEIVSPAKRLVDRQVDMVVVPGMEGNIAAMPGRAPLMLQLRGGVVALYENEKIIDRYFVDGGFVDMGADHCTILADSARLMHELSADKAKDRLQELENDLAHVGSRAEDPYDAYDRLRAEIQKAQAEIEASEGHH
ncbi:ATP synthase F1 subunit epsilon [Swingsia samuiensis]|uniref:ATP synthase epsilon chain n=1 Tax=Swingsia samuiensis TaxID=1293412 RepID=A0A4Y6UGM6_9PROT|nr:ATP synthase F1 subunit epsilon [Swingsia samuiensis]QDH16703.1 ATP synthase F1 subunit epsilon [Swingsia samuiensis]